jgi:hypothetical protein
MKLSIGCRTFVSLDVLLKMLEADSREVTLNGETIYIQSFAQTSVKGGDTLEFAFRKVNSKELLK